MTRQINYADINRRALDLLLATKKHVVTIDSKMKALVEVRVSQINGCAFCVDMHTNEARGLGEDQQRLDCLTVWKESQLFTNAEMSALNWAECITNISVDKDIDGKLAMLLDHFTESEVVDLTFIIAVMNSLNRLAIGLGDKPSKRTS